MNAIHQIVVADDKILPNLLEETDTSPHQVITPHPVMARNGPELLKELEFKERSEGQVT